MNVLFYRICKIICTNKLVKKLLNINNKSKKLVLMDSHHDTTSYSFKITWKIPSLLSVSLLGLAATGAGRGP